MFNQYSSKTCFVEIFFKDGSKPFQTYATSVSEDGNMLIVRFALEGEEWMFPLADVKYVKKS